MNRGAVPLPVRRVDKIVFHGAKEFYDKCYSNVLSSRVDQLEPEARCFIDKLGHIILMHGISPNVGNTGASSFIKIAQDHNYGRSGCKVEAKDAPAKVSREEFQRYIVQPCKELEKIMGSDFRNDVSRELPLYDVSVEEYFEIRGKLAALQSCPFIFDHEEMIWQDMRAFVCRKPRLF